MLKEPDRSSNMNVSYCRSNSHINQRNTLNKPLNQSGTFIEVYCNSNFCQNFELMPVVDPGDAEGGIVSPGPIKKVIKKMAIKGSHIDFMFLGPPYPLDPLLNAHQKQQNPRFLAF